METPLWDCVYCESEHGDKEKVRKHVQKDCLSRPESEYSCVYWGLEFSSRSQAWLFTLADGVLRSRYVIVFEDGNNQRK